MTATAVDLRTRDARIYRVNAWREMKGRPALVFDLKPGGPEWWTSANTAAWTARVWRGEAGGEAQRTWGRPYQYGDRIPKAKFSPPSAKQYKEWAKGETRPIPVTFYDGTIDTKRLALASGRQS